MTTEVLRRHRKILLDSSVWIYHFEQHAQLGRAADSVISAMEDGRIRGVVSELTLLELTVRPLRLGRQDVADEYELLLSYFPNLELEPVSRDILLHAAALRARHRLRTPDVIQLATGIRCAATVAITNDEGWWVAQSSGIETVLLSELTE